jgi:hypothetical protein
LLHGKRGLDDIVVQEVEYLAANIEVGTLHVWLFTADPFLPGV